MTAAELLEETNAAISACLKSQAYTVGERQQQRARLKELQDLRRDLMQEVQDSADDGAMAILVQVDRPS